MAVWAIACASQIQNSKRSAKVQVCRQHCNHGMFIANPRNLLNKTMPCLMNQC
ncbi:hypothetical protein CICLE_v10003840mg [Citrus x clementina]|uniref:Uncharacterized protein n=1 Tax=Citrus clementina TaxID=85681 RepID=V4SBP7_CITCL|nr:hypothetical protein CICLE_v10003840mg [Citrus x clementina]